VAKNHKVTQVLQDGQKKKIQIAGQVLQRGKNCKVEHNIVQYFFDPNNWIVQSTAKSGQVSIFGSTNSRFTSGRNFT